MKIQAIKLTGKNRKSDIMIKSGQIVTITKEDGRGITHDLDNLKTPPEPLAESETITKEVVEQRQSEINQFFTDNQIFKQGTDEILRIYVVDNFLYVNGNYLLFHDHDLNGTLEGAELDEFFDCYAKEEPDRYADHKAYFMAYATVNISAANKTIATEYFNQCIAGYTREQATEKVEAFLKNKEIVKPALKEEILLAVDKWVYKRIQCGQLKNENVDAIKARLGIE